MTMNLNNRCAPSNRLAWTGIGLVCLLALSATLGASFGHAATAGPQTFATPDAAADALIAAARADDPAALIAVLGEDASPLVSSGDDVADATARERFVEQYDTAHNLAADGDGKFTLEVGEDEWPVPIPIIKIGDNTWSFDIDAGIDELVYRRIGRNELGAIETCRGIVDAQKDYASQGHDGLPAGIYAQKLVSDAGKHNGLYWKSAPDERASPVGPFIAEAAAEGYRATGTAQKPAPYHGYIYRLLKAQGPAASGGARSYLDKGQLTGGFAVVAYPVDYESSGVETFIINQDGVLYQKNLGADTEKLAAAIDAFNPDATWTKVD